MNYLLLAIFGLAPSIVWLLYFLQKDVHPEDNRQVLKVFIYGFLAVVPTALIQLGLSDFIGGFLRPSILTTSLILFLVVALTEEIFKYLVVKNKVLSTPEFDEPIDLPLYLIISALGFAAAENMLVIWGLGIFSITFEKTLFLSAFRFISATFLHALASGTLGIFLALGFYKAKFRKRLFLLGFVLAISLHGLYNFSIMVIGGSARFLIPVLILVNLALVLSLGLRKLKELKSVCEIK